MKDGKYIKIFDSKIYYTDRGAGDTFLFIHGNPSSSYLWRNIISELDGAGRCIAIDLVGMGKSDKPKIDYRLRDHIEYLNEFIKKLNLKDIILVLHDWGAALGFNYAVNNIYNIKGIVFMEAILFAVKSWQDMDEGTQSLFRDMRDEEKAYKMVVEDNFFVELVLPAGIKRKLSDEEMANYREPYLKKEDRLPILQWTKEVSIEGVPKDVTEIIENYNLKLRNINCPKLLLYAKPGALIKEKELNWCKNNLKNLEIKYIGEGIHFIQEDNPCAIAKEIKKWKNRVYYK